MNYHFQLPIQGENSRNIVVNAFMKKAITVYYTHYYIFRYVFKSLFIGRKVNNR